MFEVKMRFRTLMPLLAAVLLSASTSYLHAQELPAPAADPIEQLRLTPEQQQRIRIILEGNKEERQQINRRLREANVALDQALDTEPTDETVIDQRLTELAAAQAAQMRMRIQTELKIRRELRPEQLATLRRLRLQARDFVGAQRPLNQRRLNQRPAQTLRPRN
jgi:Spy/CpxP family protein refolding chaperone